MGQVTCDNVPNQSTNFAIENHQKPKVSVNSNIENSNVPQEHCVPLEFASEQPIDEVVNNLPSKFLNTNTNTISKSDFNVPNENTNVEKPSSKLELYEPSKTIEIIER